MLTLAQQALQKLDAKLNEHFHPKSSGLYTATPAEKKRWEVFLAWRESCNALLDKKDKIAALEKAVLVSSSFGNAQKILMELREQDDGYVAAYRMVLDTIRVDLQKVEQKKSRRYQEAITDEVVEVKIGEVEVKSWKQIVNKIWQEVSTWQTAWLNDRAKSHRTNGSDGFATGLCQARSMRSGGLESAYNLLMHESRKDAITLGAATVARLSALPDAESAADISVSNSSAMSTRQKELESRRDLGRAALTALILLADSHTKSKGESKNESLLLLDIINNATRQLSVSELGSSGDRGMNCLSGLKSDLESEEYQAMVREVQSFRSFMKESGASTTADCAPTATSSMSVA